MAAKAKSKNTTTSKPVVAKESDGSIQITFTIPFAQIKKNREEVAIGLGKDIEVPGFRKGKAPLDKLLGQIPANTLVEKVLSKILPQLLADTVDKNKLRLAIYPKYELVSAEEGKDWQIRAKTAEIPDFEVGDYKNIVKSEFASDKIWTPDKAKKDVGKEEKKEMTQMEKEQKVMEILLKNIKVTVPKMLLEEEVNSRLSQLLERIEKLGLKLESYLASVGKDTDKLRSEYEKQAKESISLELILSKIAEEEKIAIGKEQIDAAIKASSADPNLAMQLDTPEKRRAALSRLTSAS